MSEQEKKFEAPTQDEANRLADQWWMTQKGLRLVHKTQIPVGFGGQTDLWIVTIYYEPEE